MKNFLIVDGHLCFVPGAIDLESSEVQIEINDTKNIKEMTAKKVRNIIVYN